MIDFKILNLDIAHRALAQALNLQHFSLHLDLISFDSLPPAFFNNQVFLIDEEADQQERRREELRVSENFHHELVLRWDVRLVEVGAVRSEHFLVFVLPDDHKGDGNCEHGGEIANLHHNCRWQLDYATSHLLQVVHLVDEAWHSLQEAKDLVLLRFTLDFLQELLFGQRGQKAALRLDDEENDL